MILRGEGTIRLLRGQVVIREMTERVSRGGIIIPDNVASQVQHDRQSHRGKVLAMGAPALTLTGAEVPQGFRVGDEVFWHWEHNEKAHTRPWIDGEDACWVAQHHVDGVVEP